MTTATTAVSVNAEQRLFVIPCGRGYTCLGFDVCERRSVAYAKWLGVPVPVVANGSLEAYAAHETLVDQVRVRCETKNVRCDAELTKELVGLEGKRVEVVDCDGETRRFYVGKSMGFIPIHLEIKSQRSSGGMGVYGTPFKSVRVIGNR